jgi:hypothetical protein
VIDRDGRPLVGARVDLLSESRRIISNDDGRFRFRNVALGTHAVAVERIGFKPAHSSIELGATAVAITIVLEAIPRILDSIRIRERASPNRYSAVVLDDNGSPISEVSITAEGIDNAIRSDLTGRFNIPGQIRGTLVIRMRKMGYRAYLGSLRVLASREDTLRMSRLPQTLATVQIADESGFGRDTFALLEFDQRLRWKDERVGVVPREELSEMGRMNLCDALSFTPTGSRYGIRGDCATACVILNGDGKTLMPATAFYADQVETVEYYPAGSERTGSLEARGCGRRTGSLVIWMRKDISARP